MSADSAGSGVINEARDARLVITGGAGLVGFNLVIRLLEAGYRQLVVLDKHAGNLRRMRALFPAVKALEVDLAERGDWTEELAEADALVLLHAQIGSNDEERFLRNNVLATRNVLEAATAAGVGYLVHVSSSVVATPSGDRYTRSKQQQEALVQAAGIPGLVLRPTLMFGWFDRKHLGWLSRFMARWPIFPLPGSGRYARQPLYVGDFCAVIQACLEQRIHGAPVDVSGLEQIDYVDIIRQVRAASGARAVLLPIPVSLFALLLRIWALFDNDPPFTADQLASLVAGDCFTGTDWPGRFGVEPTPFASAVRETFQHPRYGGIALEF